MPMYRFYFLNRIGSAAGHKSAAYDSDDEARTGALEILRARPRVETIEVYRNGDVAHRLSREALLYE